MQDKEDAQHAYKLIQTIMARLELILHPEKTQIVGLWTGEEGFDFLGMHHRKTKAETGLNRVYYTTQQWLCTKADKHVQEVVKERLAPPRMRYVSFQEHVDWLNLRIQDWKNYYATPYSKWMTELDWYIRQRLTK